VCLPPVPQKIPSRVRNAIPKNLHESEKDKIRKGRGKTASKDLRKRKKNYEQELKQRLAVLTQEAKDLDKAEAALKGQRTTLLAHITGAAPPSTTAASAIIVGMTFEPAVFEFISQQSKFLLCVITMIFASSMRDWVPAAPSSQLGLAMTRKSMTGSFPTTSSTLSSAAHGRKTRAMACLWKPPRPKLHRHLAPAA